MMEVAIGDTMAVKVRITEMVTVKSIFVAWLLSFINTILCYLKKTKGGNHSKWSFHLVPG